MSRLTFLTLLLAAFLLGVSLCSHQKNSDALIRIYSKEPGAEVMLLSRYYERYTASGSRIPFPDYCEEQFHAAVQSIERREEAYWFRGVWLASEGN